MFSRLWRTTKPAAAYGTLFPKSNSLSDFVVRKIRTPEELRVTIMERAQAEGWRPGALDHVSYFAADSTGFLVRELDGKPISCISAVKFAPDFAFLGFYIVDRNHQGKGYGLYTWKVSLASLPESCNMGGVAVIENVPLYGQYGFKPYWEEQRFEFVASEVLDKLADFNTIDTAIKIVPFSQQFYMNVLKYDTAVNVFQRHSFLRNWLLAPNCHFYVAIDSFGTVVGYGVVRSTLRKEDGWRIGPLFADNSAIAKIIFKELCKQITQETAQAAVVIDIPYGLRFNKHSLSLVSQCNGKPLERFVRIYKYGIPENMLLDKVFGLTSLKLG